MKNFTLLLIGFFLLSCQKASSPLEPKDLSLGEPVGFQLADSEVSTIAPSVRLRKLSFHLRGLTPEIAEYEGLQTAIQKNELQKFFAEKTKEYLASPRHLGKMYARFDDLYHLKLSAKLPESRYLNPIHPGIDPSTTAGGEDYNTLGFIFEKIIKENLSWDLLLTTKDFFVQSPASSFGVKISDIDFFRPIAPDLPGETNVPPQKYELLKVNVKPDDTRVAGTITTARFFNRYSTTNLNKSRGRAAAIFRIFLCDDMRATVETKPEEEEELLKNAFPKKEDPDPFHDGLTDEDPHGSQPACMACHYKLDPLGKLFVNYGNVMATEAAPGALVFKKEDGTLVNEKGKGLGEVLSFLVKQEEYKRCQVKRFWRWFIRGDQDPDEARLKGLVKVFDEMGHRPNDFIAYLVNEPEFLMPPENVVSTVNLSHVTPYLIRCDQCHVDKDSTVMPGSKIPSFLNFPVGGNEKNHRAFIKSIALKLALKTNGIGKKMPPESSPWQPTSNEIAVIKDWVRQGAKGLNNQPSIDEALAKSLVEE